MFTRGVSASKDSKTSVTNNNNSRAKVKTSLVFQKADSMHNDVEPILMTSRSSTRRTPVGGVTDGMDVLSPWLVTSGNSVPLSSTNRKPVASVKQSKAYPLTTEL